MSKSKQKTCQHSAYHDEQGYTHCNRLRETTIYRKDKEKEVCEKHAEYLTSDEFILSWERR